MAAKVMHMSFIKVILPPSALEKLSSLDIEYPMLFHISSNVHNTFTHAGVLEFIAEEGRIYLPQWMMKSLQVSTGEILMIQNTTLPLGKFVKIQPQSVAFLDITDPKAVLERAFRSFSTLTRGDIISFQYNDSLYDILVMQVKPETQKGGICIIETDLEVDFAPPVGYVEPAEAKKAASQDRLKESIQGSLQNIGQYVKKEDGNSFSAFTGKGQSLKGKAKVEDSGAADISTSETAPAALHLPPGKLFFGYPVKPRKSDTPNEPKFFQGEGISLRQSRSRKD